MSGRRGRPGFTTLDDDYSTTSNYIVFAAVVLFPGFSINNFLQGRPLLGVLSLGIVGVLVGNSLLVAKKGYNALRTFAIQVPIILFFIGTVFVYQGVIGALWSTPALLSFYFMLLQRYA